MTEDTLNGRGEELVAEMEGRPFTAEKSLDDAIHEMLVQSMKEHLKSFEARHKEPIAVSAQQGMKLMIRLVEEIYPYKDYLSSMVHTQLITLLTCFITHPELLSEYQKFVKRIAGELNAHARELISLHSRE